MHIFHSIQEIPPDFGPSVVTIGNFDGVHRGHQAVLQEMIARARALHARSIAVTFDPHPVRVLRPQIPLRLITQQEQKLAWPANSGIDAVVVLPFTRELSRLTAREFARNILHDSLHAIEVHEGDNFRFGADADADVNDLSSLGEDFGLRFTLIPQPIEEERLPPAAPPAVRSQLEICVPRANCWAGHSRS